MRTGRQAVCFSDVGIMPLYWCQTHATCVSPTHLPALQWFMIIYRSMTCIHTCIPIYLIVHTAYCRTTVVWLTILTLILYGAHG